MFSFYYPTRNERLMLILHNVSMRVYVRVHVRAERESVSEDSYENHVRHAGGM